MIRLCIKTLTKPSILQVSRFGRNCSLLKTSHIASPASLPKRAYSVSTDGRIIPEEIDNLSINQYHKIADQTLDTMMEDLENLMDEKDVDLEAEMNVSIVKPLN